MGSWSAWSTYSENLNQTKTLSTLLAQRYIYLVNSCGSMMLMVICYGSMPLCQVRIVWYLKPCYTRIIYSKRYDCMKKWYVLYIYILSVEGRVCNLFGLRTPYVSPTHRQKSLHVCSCWCCRSSRYVVVRSTESELFSIPVTFTFCRSLFSYGSWREILVVLPLMYYNWSQTIVKNTNQSQWVVSILVIFHLIFYSYFWIRVLFLSPLRRNPLKPIWIPVVRGHLLYIY